jgi:hypothetical protein
MVAQMTNHDADYIWRRVPFARGLQYQTAWYLLQKGIERIPVHGKVRPAGLDTVI